MMSPRGADAYRRLEAQSRSPIELVVMLYDGALRFTQAAREAHARGDRRARAQAIARTMAIVTELQNTLNLDDGGPVGRELDRLYSYVTVRLVDVGMKNDGSALDEVARLLTTVRDGWSSIAAPVPAVSATMPSAALAAP